MSTVLGSPGKKKRENNRNKEWGKKDQTILTSRTVSEYKSDVSAVYVTLI